MKTPIIDFLKKYDGQKPLRLHMPGHKGKGRLGFENLDLTEISGADSLFSASGIIAESERNASDIFGVKTYYSTEGSSLAIRAMLYLCYKYAKSKGQKPFILAGRNAHKSFISALGLLDFKVKWLYSSKKDGYLSCKITASQIDKRLSKLKQKPVAVYLTSPDYLGNILDIKSVSKVCKKHGVLLLVDSAHGSYLKFLKESLFPTDLGADMCCSSAHKTLPVLTGGAYLHLGKEIENCEICDAKFALSLFASTSPSYLIMASLDEANAELNGDYAKILQDTVKRVEVLKKSLKKGGYKLLSNEPLKVTVLAKEYGYKGTELSAILENNGVFCEFSDADFLVMMFTADITESDYERLEKVFLSIPKKSVIKEKPPVAVRLKAKTSVKNAIFSLSETLPVEKCEGRVLCSLNLSCPPAVQIICSGEIITKKAIEVLKYYQIKQCDVVK
ncbi:MAG: aminotransferase class V-fold PLP-dependent enzyme [Clostridia bacterium]|nr:aminotransferase class V-fold PLP-dependent enzyme [Clostridia bacterium]